MNKNKLKAYAPAARREFIQAVTDRANLMGLSEGAVERAELRGDVMLIAGRAYPKEVYPQRQALEARVRREGFRQVIEEAAYSWFNRFTALRYMELHGYLEHGLRVLSNPSGSHIPEILEKATQVELQGLPRERVVELKLAGDKDAELYRMLLVAQCNQLHRAMPFLFERINDETELLLPDNLLHSDSLIRRLVTGIDEADWQQVEIIGWLYQFYISERKDEVIGRVVKSEDIPAATQLFTPNWIVKYMVQNSVGRMWLQTYPSSALKGKMEYYIEPAEQAAEVKAGLKRITPEAIDPEAITVLDPACGSGHILVEAYDVLKEIYQERGYRGRDIARLILEKNLYGLDIDERAAQLASFALLMKARGDDRRILEDAPRLNVMAIEESRGMKAEELAGALLQVRSQPRSVPIVGEDKLWGEMSRQGALMVGAAGVETAGASAAAGVSREEIVDLLELFREGKTFGSLIGVPDDLAQRLPAMREIVEENLESGELYAREAASALLPFVRQAEMLAGKYDCVIANPPYMGGKGMNADVKEFAKKKFPDSKSDLFAMFIERATEHTKANGYAAFVTPFVWMFISSYEKFRKNLIEETPLTSLIQLEYNAFEPACVPVCTFTMKKNGNSKLKGEFIKLSDFKGHQNQAPKTLEAIENPNCGWRFQATTSDFEKIPGSPIAYWVSDKVREIFDNKSTIKDHSIIFEGLKTRDNPRFLRLWFETDSEDHWKKYSKGGGYRKWYGNDLFVLNWKNDGEEIKNFKTASGQNFKHFELPTISYCTISSSYFSARFIDKSFFGGGGAGITAIDSTENLYVSLGLLNTTLIGQLLNLLSPTLNFEVGTVGSITIPDAISTVKEKLKNIVEEAVAIARADWDSFETSWDFASLPLIQLRMANDELRIEETDSVEECWKRWNQLTTRRIARMQELETENNRLFINAYGLEDELAPEVPLEQITLMRADAEKDARRLLSYFIGCLMGRYSLDEAGLIYADAGGIGFDPSRYQTFAADDDGIIPVTDLEWFPQEAARQFEKFVRAVWGEAHSNANLRWLAGQLGAKAGETPIETIRRYFSAQFYKDHMQTYKKRPIYWLFSSGKQKAFECLVYLHRYSPATLSRMRNEYVTPLFGKLSAQIEYLTGEVAAASSTAARNKQQKTLDALKKKRTELQAFDDGLRHYADQRIALDLDDGVKVNYGKFGNLLAEVKQVAADTANE